MKIYLILPFILLYSSQVKTVNLEDLLTAIMINIIFNDNNTRSLNENDIENDNETKKEKELQKKKFTCKKTRK